MSQENRRFVIQEHSTEHRAERIHWDFMLESENGSLQTYRLDKAPQELATFPANAVKIFDHPLRFLTYHGPVNKGQGKVRITESGTYKIIRQDNDRLELNLHGRILKGKFTLTHIEGDSWRFCAEN